MSASFCLCFIKLSATDCYVVTVLYEILDAFLQSEQTWTSLYQCDAIDRERALKICHLKQFVHHYVGVSVTLYVNYDAHALTSSLVVDIADSVNLAFLDEFCDILDKLLLIYTVRYFCYYDSVMSIFAFDFSLSAYHDTSATSLISILYALNAIDISACREVRSLDILHQSVCVNIRIVYISATSVNDFSEIMSRDISSHTHSNTVSSIDQEIRNLGRHHSRFLQSVIEVVCHIDGILLQVVHDVLTHL